MTSFNSQMKFACFIMSHYDKPSRSERTPPEFPSIFYTLVKSCFCNWFASLVVLVKIESLPQTILHNDVAVLSNPL